MFLLLNSEPWLVKSKEFQIYGKLQFLEDVLANQNIDFRYFYSYATTTLHIPPIAPAVTSTFSPIDPVFTALIQVLSSSLRRR